MSKLNRSRRATTRGTRARRGIALFVAMFFVAGVGALALSAIYLTANATLLGKTYEKEDDLKYVSEAALAIGKSELNFNPAALPNTSFVALMTNKTLTAADATPVTGVTVNLYVGPSGSTSGQFGRFASIVSEARDANGTGFVRRLEVTQESFAKFAYWSNSESGGSIVFGGGDQLWGPVWSNDVITIHSSGATFHDEVGTAATISGASNGTFVKGYQTNQRVIALPSLSSLSTLSGLASAGSMNYTAPSTGDESTVRRRIEFVAADMDGITTTDSTHDNEGFYRIYTVSAGNESWLRGDWPGTSSTLPTNAQLLTCGDWHPDSTGIQKFFPAAVHTQAWFDTVTSGGLTVGTRATRIATAHTEGASGVTAIMSNPGARCYLGGDPHLVAVQRTTGNGYALTKIRIGGTDTTFTPVDPYGSWLLYSNSPPATMTARRPNDAKYLFPLYRGFNTNTKGVIYVGGTVGVSGVLRGGVTLYALNTVVILDDLRYATDPGARGTSCPDILGIISGDKVVVADNAINSPQYISVAGSGTIRSLDDTPDLYIHAVIMALGPSFTVENYNQGSQTAVPCQTTPWGRGCLYLTGGLIQNTRGAVGVSNGTGYLKRYSYDHCAVINPPPYFPTTGRFQDNRYYELDPVRFNVTQLFHSLTPGP